MLNRSGPTTEPWGTPLFGPGRPASFYPAKRVPIQAASSHFRQENAVGNGVKGLTNVKVDNIHSLSLMQSAGRPVVEGDQIC